MLRMVPPLRCLIPRNRRQVPDCGAPRGRTGEYGFVLGSSLIYPRILLHSASQFFYVVLAHLLNIYKSGNSLLFLLGLSSVLVASAGVMQLWRGLDGMIAFLFCGPFEKVNWKTLPFSQDCGDTPLYWEMHALSHCLLFNTGLIDIKLVAPSELPTKKKA